MKQNRMKPSILNCGKSETFKNQHSSTTGNEFKQTNRKQRRISTTSLITKNCSSLKLIVTCMFIYASILEALFDASYWWLLNNKPILVQCMIVNTNLPSRTTSVGSKPSKPPSTGGYNRKNYNYQNNYQQRFGNQPNTPDIDYSNEQNNDERRLFNYLMRNYDNTIRPVHNASKPINIRLGITLTQIFDLDEKNQVLTTNVWLDQEWIDEFLTWNSSEFGNITKIRIPCQSIWLPDIVLYNNADDYTRGYMNSRAVIEPDGNVFWPPPTKFRSTCQVDVTYFPFDDQSCLMKLGSWIYDGNSVNIENRTQNVDLSNYVSNGEWDLIRTSLVRNVVYYPCCIEPFPDVTITLVIRRKILYYMYNVIVPCIMMSLLTLLVFCLPPESGEKIALGVTVLLAFSVFMLAISEKLPETSESIPLLGVYLTVVMGITSISIVMTVVVLNFHYCSPLNKRELPKWIKSWIVTDQTIFDDYFMARSMSMSAEPVNEDEEQDENVASTKHSQTIPTTTTEKHRKTSKMMSNHIHHTSNILSAADLQLLSPTTEDSTTTSTLLSNTNNCSKTNEINHNNNSKINNLENNNSKPNPEQQQQLEEDQNPNIAFWDDPRKHSNVSVKRSSVAEQCYYRVHHQNHQHHHQTLQYLQHYSGQQPNQFYYRQPQSSSNIRPSQDLHYRYQPNSSAMFQEREDLCNQYGIHSSKRAPSMFAASGFMVNNDNSKIDLNPGLNLNTGNNNRQLLNTIAPIVCATTRLVHRGQMAASPTIQTEHCNDQNPTTESSSYKTSAKVNRPFSTTTAYRRRPASSPEGTEQMPPPPPPPAPSNYSRQEWCQNEQNINRDDEKIKQPNRNDLPSDANDPNLGNGLDQEMVQMLRYIMYRQEVDDNISRRIHEWRLFSMFLDKVLFWVFTVSTIITSLVFLLIIPVKRRGF